MKIIFRLICLLLFSAAGSIQAAEFSGKVIAVMDGDTLMVMQGSKRTKIRLAEVDAPEKAQPYGDASRQSLAEMVMGRQVQVKSRAIDDYGRMVAIVSVAGLNVNHEQVRRGLAWEYSRFHNNREVMALQREAQQAKRGLWAEEGNVEPSQWRKLHPSTFAAAEPSREADPQHTSRLNDPSCPKKNCSQMASCAEAKDYLTRCGIKMLDGDGDGMPCEALCASTGIIKN